MKKLHAASIFTISNILSTTYLSTSLLSKIFNSTLSVVTKVSKDELPSPTNYIKANNPYLLLCYELN